MSENLTENIIEIKKDRIETMVNFFIEKDIEITQEIFTKYFNEDEHRTSKKNIIREDVLQILIKDIKNGINIGVFKDFLINYTSKQDNIYISTTQCVDLLISIMDMGTDFIELRKNISLYLFKYVQYQNIFSSLRMLHIENVTLNGIKILENIFYASCANLGGRNIEHEKIDFIEYLKFLGEHTHNYIENIRINHLVESYGDIHEKRMALMYAKEVNDESILGHSYKMNLNLLKKNNLTIDDGSIKKLIYCRENISNNKDVLFANKKEFYKENFYFIESNKDNIVYIYNNFLEVEYCLLGDGNIIKTDKLIAYFECKYKKNTIIHYKQEKESECYFEDHAASIYKDMINFNNRNIIENDLGIKLQNISIREQMMFLDFVYSYSKEKIFLIKEFLNKSETQEGRDNRLRLFLSLDQLGEQFGKKILELGNLEKADEIFKIYSDLIDKTENIREEVSGVIEGKFNNNVYKEIQESLFKEANKILLNFSNRKDINNTNELELELGKVGANMILMSEILDSVKKDGKKISLDELIGSVSEEKTMKNVLYELENKGIEKESLKDFLEEFIEYTKEEKNRFEEEKNNSSLNIKTKDFRISNNIFKELIKKFNIPDNGIKDLHEVFNLFKLYAENFIIQEDKSIFNLLELLKKDLLKGDESKFYISKKISKTGEVDLLAFFASEKLDIPNIKNVKKLKGLNLNQDLLSKKLKMVDSFVNNGVNKELKDSTLIATCDPWMVKNYYDKYKFFVTGISKDESGFIFTIEKNDFLDLDNFDNYPQEDIEIITDENSEFFNKEDEYNKILSSTYLLKIEKIEDLENGKKKITAKGVKRELLQLNSMENKNVA